MVAQRHSMFNLKSYQMKKEDLQSMTKDQLMEKYPNIGLKKSMLKAVMIQIIIDAQHVSNSTKSGYAPEPH